MALEKPFELAIRALWPNATGQELVALFDGRAAVTTIANWRAGRRGIPAWAIDRLHQRIDERSAQAKRHLQHVAPGPGLKAGAINLARYRARSA